MVKLALLDPVLPHQLRERADDLEGIEVVWKGTELPALLDAVRAHHPKVVVVDLDSLGPDPAARIREVEAASPSVELVITLYHFARRATVDALSGERRKAVRAPVTLKNLRSQMLGVVVRSIFSGDAREARDPKAEARIPARTYTSAQLGRLVEIPSSIQCECPNHVAQLVLALESFEDYAAACENRNDADAAVHRALHEHTARAREVMERALELLLAHEKIAV
jgi:DNA-binding NarL/FixJ family response regulator